LRVISYTVPPEQDGRRIQSLLSSALFCSGTLIKRLKTRPGSVLVNGVPAVRLVDPVWAGDRIDADVDDEEPIPETRHCRLPIFYEDVDLLILDKPAGMAVHPAGLTELSGTVAEELSAYLGGRALHPVNRLDRGTSGLMCVAKHAYAHDLLRRALHQTMTREYRAIVVGEGLPPEGVIDLPIDREEGSAVRRWIVPDGAPARTRYEVLESGGGHTLLRVLPETGRTHQIRVHFAAIGYPLAGDWLYGQEDPALIPRPALHSFRIRMTQPITHQTIDITAPLPDDMAGILALMR